VEQFVRNFIKIKQISMIKTPLEVAPMAFFVFIRVLFCYADNHMELCSSKKLQ